MGPGWRLVIAGALALYWAGWIWYYQGITHVFLLLGQCVTPCLVFACFTAARKNGAALLCALGYGLTVVLPGKQLPGGEGAQAIEAE